jgi:hypothetical protein
MQTLPAKLFEAASLDKAPAPMIFARMRSHNIVRLRAAKGCDSDEALGRV